MSGRIEEARAALEYIARMHSEETDGGMGYTATGYGHMEPVCQTCGTSDEYAVPWPCVTRQQADAAHEALFGPTRRKDTE
jgi:hypothetical protein